MARFTPAYGGFVARLDEINILRQFAASKERRDALRLRKEINALSRGAIVLLCGHLEAYIKELGQVALEAMTDKGVPRAKLSSRFYYHISQDFLTEIRNTSDPDKIADRVFAFLERDLEYWSKEGPFPLAVVAGGFNKGFANPAFKKVTKYFNRFGYATYRYDLATRLKEDFQTTVTMVDHLVDMRNKIAHGDPTASKTPREVKVMISTTQIFCRSTDAVFAEWWRDSYCAIR